MSKSSDQDLLIIAGLAVAVLYFFPKMVGQALVAIPGGVASGIITEAAKIFGVPETNVTEGQKAFAAGDYYKASQLLPAAQFISGMVAKGWAGVTGTAAPVTSENDLASWLSARGVDVATDPAAYDIFTQWSYQQDAIAAQQQAIAESIAAGMAAGG